MWIQSFCFDKNDILEESEMTVIKYKTSLEVKINNVDNRLTVMLNPDNPPGKGGNSLQVCDIVALGFPYHPENNSVIDITSAVNAIQKKQGSGSNLPLSFVGTNYAAAGNVSAYC